MHCLYLRPSPGLSLCPGFSIPDGYLLNILIIYFIFLAFHILVILCLGFLRILSFSIPGFIILVFQVKYSGVLVFRHSGFQY